MRLKLNLLGEVSFQVEGETVPTLRSRTATALLVYLAHHPQSFSREYLATLFWPDKSHETAIANLRSTIRLLKPRFEPFLTITRNSLEFNGASSHQIDSVDLEEKLDRFLGALHPKEEDLTTLGQLLPPLLATDQAIFMPGFYVSNSPQFEDWLTTSRTRHQQKIELAMQVVLKQWLKSADYQTALPAAARLAQLDPLNESVQQILLELLWRSGKRNEALKQYKAVAQLLKQELDLLPSEATLNILSRIRAQKSLPATHLPQQSTPFLGRDSELTDLFQQLMEPTCRLLTIFGPGGVGKTRMLVALGQLLCDTFPGPFPDGIYYIPLVQLSSARYLTTAIISSLGLTISGEVTPEEQLHAYFRSKELILLLDNVEHLLTESADSESVTQLIESLLQAAPRSKIVTTSRSKLNLVEEWIFGLDGLKLPPRSWDDRNDPIDQNKWAEAYPAINLFVTAAHRLNHQVKLAPSHLPAINQICHFLDGFPLGIEMAAALLDTLSPQEIEQQIEQEASQLASSLRNRPERHRSLWGVFAYSYRQLNAQIQTSFCQLSVFHSSFNVSAAKRVAGASAKILKVLVDHSLLKEIPTEDEGECLYEMHRLIRQFAGERLAQSTTHLQLVEGQHAAYFAGLLADRVINMRQGGPPEMFDLIESKIDDIRIAWPRVTSHLANRPNGAVLEEAFEALQCFYFAKGWLSEGLEMAELTAAVDSNPAIALRGKLWRAELLVNLGEYDRGESLFNDVLQDSKNFGSRQVEAEALNGLGRVMFYKGDLKSAEQHFKTGLTLAHQEEDPISISLALNCLANTVAEAHMDYDQSSALLIESLDISKEAGDQLGSARALINLGVIAQEQNRLPQAQELYEQSLDLYQTIGYQHGIASALKYLGQIATMQKDFASAQSLLTQSYDLYLKSSDRRGEADSLRQLGNTARSQHLTQGALNFYEEALAISQTIGGESLVLGILYEVAKLHQLEGRPERAARVIRYLKTHPPLGDELATAVEELEKELGSHLDPTEFVEQLTLGQMIEFALTV